MNDNFSRQAKLYADCRPHYPDALYEFLFQQVKNFDTALDVATGNGQVSVALAKRFKQVYATDISAAQLSHAPVRQNIIYKKEAAEQTTFPDHCFDLITVAQAIHWFDFDKFYNEVKRILKPAGIISVIGYGLLRVNPEINAWIDNIYWDIIGPIGIKKENILIKIMQQFLFLLTR